MTDVVTAVVTDGMRVLLLKRGERVRTYRGRWACVSGYLEGNEDPLERAITEIEEETGLKKESITLLKKGEVVTYHDKQHGVFWRIHPFLFKTDTTDIEIDWEHTTHHWVSPDEMEQYTTVPKLQEIVSMLMKS